ncbi:MAG: ABC transporter permease [Lewinellaceae bacterium]|nr:ABC transporter permease [Saprospiraceae bacterium]MCB9338252.1 ABC transporter permease [Lewinellaceae bacterium]
MNKLWLIIQREYLTRVKKKSFILLTLLSPLIFVALFIVPALLAIYTGKEQKFVAVKDDSGVFALPKDTSGRVVFDVKNESLEALKSSYKQQRYDGVLYIPALAGTGQGMNIQYFSEGQLSLGTKSYIENRVAESIEANNIKTFGYDQERLKSLRPDVQLSQKELAFNETGQLVEMDKKNSAGIATAIGYISGFIIYIVLLIYGTMIMRSVMEEKTTRIVEVIISSVKPFQLMMGKIIGVSAVGLTQMLAWITLTIALMTLAGSFLPMEQVAAAQQGASPFQQAPPEQAYAVAENLALLKSQNWAFILPVFLFYFIGGYFIYSSLFAAVGSAMGDDLGESQPLTFVAMAPIIIAIIVITPVIENPTSSLAVWMSIIPLFSPVIMPARLAFEPPIWQILLSMVILAASAFFFVWLAGRIYRVGILMYGKKGSVKELGKWLFYRD